MQDKSKLIAILCMLIICLSCSTKNLQAKDNDQTFKRYNRKDWKHWTDRDKNCFDTRQEILKERSLRPVEVRKRKKKCYVRSGLWNDYYFNEQFISPKNIDIDHLVPLKHAHDVGASSWDRSLKEKFANDPENLVITNKKYNRKKGAKRIDQWLPINITYACKYYKDWMKIKKKYGLSISREEIESVDQSKCP